ncbi:hypothetical protein SDC9_88566 [bioreactor metagenome]|uniref:Uncharacterized protein n=1 Tax=bioreactor metagenome TaxID=1076179 RepID=A0A644ZMA5_9ZZZZ
MHGPLPVMKSSGNKKEEHDVRKRLCPSEDDIHKRRLPRHRTRPLHHAAGRDHKKEAAAGKDQGVPAKTEGLEQSAGREGVHSDRPGEFRQGRFRNRPELLG